LRFPFVLKHPEKNLTVVIIDKNRLPGIAERSDMINHTGIFDTQLP